MAGIWVRSGTVTLTNGSKKVTGSGTAWSTGTNKVTKGCAFIYNNIEYEVDYINSDTELYLVDTYNGTTASGLSYRIQIVVTDTIPELSSRIAAALAYWNSQAGNLQSLVLGSGNVTLTAPDGTQVVVPSYANMQQKDALLTALAALTTATDKLPYFTGVDTVAQTTLTEFARTLLDDTDAAAMLATLGVTKASTTETNTRTAADRVVTPAGLNAVVPYTPSVNPSLDLVFSNQKYKYYAGANGLTETSDMTSLITFTRSTIATYFDAMGVMKQAAVNQPRIDYDPSSGECKGLLIEESRTNLLLYANRTSSAGGYPEWDAACGAITEPNKGISPDGLMNAIRYTPTIGSTASWLAELVTVVAGKQYCYSVYLKDDGGRYANIGFYGTTDVDNWVRFNLATGAIDSYVGSVAKTAFISPVGDGWYRCTVVFTPTGVASFQVNVRHSGWTGDGTAGFLCWGAQLEAGSFPTSFINSADTWTGRASTASYIGSNGLIQQAASGVARNATYEYDKEGVLRPTGLLLEKAATNLLLYSEQLNSWTKGNATVTTDATVAPDGNSTADKIVESTTNSTHVVAQSTVGAAATRYTLSCYAKPAERGWITLQVYDGVGYFTAFFDLVNIATGAKSAGSTTRIKRSANGFARCELTFTTNTGVSSITSNILAATGDNIATYLGDGASGVYVWGAQLAVGGYATSYIQTTSAQVTRAADTSSSAQTTRATDVATISGTNFAQLVKQYEGSVVTEVYNPSTVVGDSLGITRGVACLSDGTEANKIRVAVDAGQTTQTRKNSVDQSTQMIGAVSIGNHKTAISYKTNNVDSAVDGVAGVTDTSANIPFVTQLDVGRGAVTGGILNGHIKRIRYYPKALSSTELQAMTA